jgi:pimeloyl-ACP methyl ester carboxylesterase
VLVAESFSAPLAVWYAATNPHNLAAVVICAGFVRNPLHGWSGAVKVLAKPWLFKLKPPRTILEYFLLGQHAPPGLLQSLREALQTVRT